MSRRGRGRGTTGDMVRSLVLVSGGTVVVLLLGAARELVLPTGSNREAVKVVSYADEAAAARRTAPRAALVPADLPGGWRATSARFEPHGSAYQLHIGFVTPKQQYAAVEESVAPVPPYRFGDTARPLTALPPVHVRGETWQQQRTAHGELVLTRRTGPTTVVVTGSATLPELETLAGSLR